MEKHGMYELSLICEGIVSQNTHLSHHYLSLLSQPPSVTIIITTSTTCHYHHHNHHLSLSLSQPPFVTIIITTSTWSDDKKLRMSKILKKKSWIFRARNGSDARKLEGREKWNFRGAQKLRGAKNKGAKTKVTCFISEPHWSDIMWEWLILLYFQQFCCWRGTKWQATKTLVCDIRLLSYQIPNLPIR